MPGKLPLEDDGAAAAVFEDEAELELAPDRVFDFGPQAVTNRLREGTQ